MNHNSKMPFLLTIFRVLLPTTTAVLLIKQYIIELTIMRSRILTMEVVKGLPVVVLYGGK